MSSPGCAIALSGPMAVGKSSVARALAADYGLTVLSFGELVRAEARSRQQSEDRPALQELGQRIVRDWGPTEMVDRLLAGRREDVVIDGVRHLSVLVALKDRLPQLLYVFLHTDEAELARRWTQRGDLDRGPDVKTHGVEQELSQLQASATASLNTSEFSPDALAQIIVFLAERKFADG